MKKGELANLVSSIMNIKYDNVDHVRFCSRKGSDF